MRVFAHTLRISAAICFGMCGFVIASRSGLYDLTTDSTCCVTALSQHPMTPPRILVWRSFRPMPRVLHASISCYGGCVRLGHRMHVLSGRMLRFLFGCAMARSMMVIASFQSLQTVVESSQTDACCTSRPSLISLMVGWA